MPLPTLLARIRKPALSATRSEVPDADVRASILANLQALCSTRLGSVLTCSTFGTRCVTDVVHSCPDALDEFARGIRRAIEGFEPRLKSVVVRPVKSEEHDPLTLRFEITASMVRDRRSVPVRFQTVIQPSRKIEVA